MIKILDKIINIFKKDIKRKIIPKKELRKKLNKLILGIRENVVKDCPVCKISIYFFLKIFSIN